MEQAKERERERENGAIRRAKERQRKRKREAKRRKREREKDRSVNGVGPAYIVGTGDGGGDERVLIRQRFYAPAPAPPAVSDAATIMPSEAERTISGTITSGTVLLPLLLLLPSVSKRFLSISSYTHYVTNLLLRKLLDSLSFSSLSRLLSAAIPFPRSRHDISL